jgi:hypothetical protein
MESTAMLCEQAREHLSAYLDKELTSELSAAVRAHLETCAECRALLADLRATAGLLGRLPVRRAPEHIATDVQREMERRSILEESPRVEPQPQERTLAIHRVRPWPRVMAVAATLVLAAGIGVLAWLSREGGRAAAPSPVALSDGPAVTLEWADTGKAGALLSLELAEEARAYGLADGAVERDAAGYYYYDKRGGGAVVDRARGRAVDPAALAAANNLADPAGREGAFGNTGVSRVSPPAGVAGGEVAPDVGRMSRWSLDSYVVAKGPGHALEINGMPVDLGLARANILGSLALGRDAEEKAAPTLRPAPVTRKADGRLATDLKAGGPSAVQAVMNYVAAGEAGVEDLQAVANRSNLDRADNQIVLAAESRDDANRELRRLFAANGFQAIAAEERMTAAATATTPETFDIEGKAGEAAAKAEAGDAITEATGAGSAGKAAGGEVASKAKAGKSFGKGAGTLEAGVYYLASRNGEDTWVVLTDPDTLSRFGSQLAQTSVATVSTDSSEQFQALGELQERFRSSQTDLAKRGVEQSAEPPALGALAFGTSKEEAWARTAGGAAAKGLGDQEGDVAAAPARDLGQKPAAGLGAPPPAAVAAKPSEKKASSPGERQSTAKPYEGELAAGVRAAPKKEPGPASQAKASPAAAEAHPAEPAQQAPATEVQREKTEAKDLEVARRAQALKEKLAKPDDAAAARPADELDEAMRPDAAQTAEQLDMTPGGTQARAPLPAVVMGKSLSGNAPQQPAGEKVAKGLARQPMAEPAPTQQTPKAGAGTGRRHEELRRLNLPRNQVLLVVRVRQATPAARAQMRAKYAERNQAAPADATRQTQPGPQD